MKTISQHINVSRETILPKQTIYELKAYESSLHEWQKKFNLVSIASLENSWNRHFADSIQLFPLIPTKASTLIDFGSGAGFPGLVLAIMAKELLPSLHITLVESIKKKTLYLKHVADLTNTNVTILNDRVENLKPQPYDVITSRAMTSLPNLLQYTQKFVGPQTICIFPKGKSHQQEIIEAQKLWKFETQILPSQESDEGVILIITNIQRR